MPEAETTDQSQQLIRQPELENLEGAPIPMYDPNDQIVVANGENIETTIGIEVTRAIREMTWLTGMPRNILGGEGLIWAIQHTNREVGIHFLAHGFAKNPIHSLFELMQNGLTSNRTLYGSSFVDVGDAGGAFGADTPKTEGGIMIVTDYDQSFSRSGDPNCKFIFLGEEFMRVVDLIQEQFSERGILVVPWHDIPKVLTKSFNELNEDNMLTYSTVERSSLIRYDPKKDPRGGLEPIALEELANYATRIPSERDSQLSDDW